MAEPQVEDATRRTRLANERTYLAWWRTGLTGLAVAVGVGRLVPGVSPHTTRWPYEALGAAYGVVAIGFIVAGYGRNRAVARALERGEYAPLTDRLVRALTLAGLALGVATIALVVFVH
jgi:putative membrane protein